MDAQSTSTQEVDIMVKMISVSDAVHKALEESGRDADSILREVLKVKSEGLAAAEGVVFPEGTAFLAWYKDRPYWGHVRDGMLEIQGERFTSVSGAAKKVTRRPTNGWDFWTAKLPGTADFVRISKLRSDGGSSDGS